jgi:VWFA-related protein
MVLSAALGWTQQVPPQPPKTDEKTNAQDTNASVIRVSVNLVQIDATVTDAQGHAVSNLEAKDFEVLQDGKGQTITKFSYVSAPPAVELRSGVSAPTNPSKIRVEDVHRTVALVVDDLGLSFESTARVRQALKHYVDTELQPGDLVAVLRTGAGVGALQQFTTDHRMLDAAIERVRYNFLGGGPLGAFAPLESHLSNFPTGVNLAQANGTSPSVDFDQERRQIFAAGALGAVRYVVDGLRTLPGRKVLVLFSENMQLFYNGEPSQRVQEALKQLVDAANRSAVVIYAIDPGGLRYYGLTAADDTSLANPQSLNTLAVSRSMEEYDAREGMVLLAHATGGLFLKNTNDIDGALRQAMTDSGGYYLLGYQPDAATFDTHTGQPRFHSLKVRVKRTGLRVRSRSGFFGVADTGPPTNGRTPREQMLNALVSPFSSGDIHLRVTALFKDETKGGPVLDVLLYIDARELLFEPQPDGTRKATFDAAAATFDENGTPVESTLRTFSVVVKESDFQSLGKAGIVYVLEHPAKKAGPYQVRVAIRDGASSRMGSASQFIEIPDVRRGHLALSSVVLAQDSFGLTGSATASETDGKAQRSSPAVRVFQPGTTVLYVYQVLNAKTDSAGHPVLESQVRVFRNGEEIYSGKPSPAMTQDANAKDRLLCAGAIALGTKMVPGDYVLQVAVTDKLAKSKHALAAEAMDFEVRP